jgi:hypothetical protein
VVVYWEVFVAPFGFQITKKVTWRGNEEQFSNVYHYNMGATLSVADADAMLVAIRNAELPAFGTNVGFIQGRAFGPTDQGQAANNMIDILDWTGVNGSQSGGLDIPYEETLVVENFIGRGPQGRKQFLRKYLHICRVAAADSGAPQLGNGTITGNMSAIGVAYWNRIKQITAASNQWKLCTKLGKLYDNIADAPVVLPNLHVRQFHQ